LLLLPLSLTLFRYYFAAIIFALYFRAIFHFSLVMNVIVTSSRHHDIVTATLRCRHDIFCVIDDS